MPQQQRLGDLLAADALGVVEYAAAEVLGGEHAVGVDDVDQYRGAQHLQRLAGDRVLVHGAVQAQAHVPVALGVGDGRRLVAESNDGLQVLGAHDGAQAAAAGGAVAVVEDRGEGDEVLAGLADAGHRRLGPDPLLQRLLRLLRVQSPDPGGVAHLDAGGGDGQVNGALGAAADDQAVQAGALEGGAEAAARAGIADGPGQGRARHDLEAPRGHHRPGERAGHEEDGVLGGQGIERLRAQVGIEPDPQAASPQVAAAQLVADRDLLLPAASQVDGDDPSHPAVHDPSLIRRSG